MKKIETQLIEIFDSFGFKGYVKPIYYINKRILMYYFSFTGRWGIHKKYPNKEFRDYYFILENENDFIKFNFDEIEKIKKYLYNNFYKKF